MPSPADNGIHPVVPLVSSSPEEPLAGVCGNDLCTSTSEGMPLEWWGHRRYPRLTVIEHHAEDILKSVETDYEGREILLRHVLHR